MWYKCLCALLLIANMAAGNERYGDCSTVHQGELIWRYEVRRNPNFMPFQSAEAQYGPTRVTIKCIDVNSTGEDSGVARITSGGVGTNHVNFNFVTTRGKPMRIKVLVYRY